MAIGVGHCCFSSSFRTFCGTSSNLALPARCNARTYATTAQRSQRLDARSIRAHQSLAFGDNLVEIAIGHLAKPVGVVVGRR